jgi:hypothetical protein
MDNDDLLQKITNIIHTKGYAVQVEKSDNSFIFYLSHNELDKQCDVACLMAQITKGEIVPSYNTRNRIMEENDNVVHIHWLGVTQPSQGLGSLLLLYSLYYFKLIYFAQYATLDDDSNKSTDFKNIYSNVGFEFIDPISLDDKKHKIKISGPEKQLKLDKNFMTRTTQILQKYNTVSSAGTKKRKTKKRKSNKSKRRRPLNALFNERNPIRIL